MGVAFNGNVHRYRLMKEIPIWEKSNLTLEEAAAREENESTLIAEIGEKIIIYPQRMSQENQEFFQITPKNRNFATSIY